MRIKQEQLESYEKNGFLLLPNYFLEEEVKILRSELPGVFAEDSPARIT